MLLDGDQIGEGLQGVAGGCLHTEYGATRILDELLDNALLVVGIAVRE